MRLGRVRARQRQGKGLQQFRAAGKQGHVGAQRCQGFRCRQTDALAAAADERVLASQVEVHRDLL